MHTAGFSYLKWGRGFKRVAKDSTRKVLPDRLVELSEILEKNISITVSVMAKAKMT